MTEPECLLLWKCHVPYARCTAKVEPAHRISNFLTQCTLTNNYTVFLMTWLLATEWTTSLLHSNWWCCMWCALLSSVLFLSKMTLCGFRKMLHIKDLCSIMTFNCHFYISSLTSISHNMHMCTKITCVPVNEAHIKFMSSAGPIMLMNISRKMKQH